MNEARIASIAKKIASFDDYDSQLGEAIGNHGQDIHGWKASWEYPGYIEWSKNGESKTIQATPFFEGRPSICVQVTDDGADLGGFDIPMRKTENVDHDAIQYINLMRSNWSRVESFLKVKAASMNESRIARISDKIIAIGIRSPEGPRPKFDVGDKVVTHSPNMTEVWEVGDWDEHLQDRRYRVMDPVSRQKLWMNEKGMKKAGMKVSSQSGNEAFKALKDAWDNLNSAKNSLQEVLRDDSPDNPQEVIASIKELEHICWMVSVYKRQAIKL